MKLEAIKYSRGDLEILNQVLLPHKSEYIPIKNCEDGWIAIRKMQVRGAPAIAIVGALSLAEELLHKDFDSVCHVVDHVIERLEYLVTARPTAVNMADAAASLSAFAKHQLEMKADHTTVQTIKLRIVEEIEAMLCKDVDDNRHIGDHGANCILEHAGGSSVSILTHCNTGSLATAGYGTALGVVRSLHKLDRLKCCYFTETRPYNQGARLTAYELLTESIPHQLICDSMAASLVSSTPISAIVVGADRVVANGDTANKIGTYQLAVVAKYHNVPFYVCAPTTSIDFSIKTGDGIAIEERSHAELTSINGVPIAPYGVNCWNPAFDVTPGDLITGGIVTEHGIFSPQNLDTLKKYCIKS